MSVNSAMTAIADAIRAKTGGTEPLTLAQMPSAIASIKGGGEAPEYTRVGFIQFTGDQSIDTGIVPNQDTKIRVAFTRESDSSVYMYGVASSGNTASVTAYVGSSGSWRFGSKSISRNLSMNDEVIHTAIVSSAGITHAGGTNTYSSQGDFEAIGSLLLGACRNADGSIGTAQFVGKVYVFEMWQGDEKVLDLVPCRSADGEYGFFDEVSGAFIPSITDTPFDGAAL